MCGRYTLTASAEELASHFWVDCPPAWRPRYNIAPSQPVPVVVASSGAAPAALRPMVWGLAPSWGKDPSIGVRLINARSETAAEKPAFRAALRRRRCVIPADGFYEWKRTASGKQPYHVALKDRGLFGFAGLWETWHSPSGSEVDGCTILTTTPNPCVAEIHDRMPVILNVDHYPAWMDLTVEDPVAVAFLLRPFPDECMTARRVGRAVNRVTNDVPSCLEPDPQAELF